MADGDSGLGTTLDPWWGYQPGATTDTPVQGANPPWYSNIPGLGGGGVSLPPGTIPAAIGAGGGVLGALIGSHGATDAANISAQYLQQALKYEKQRDAYLQQLEASRYGNIQNRLSPYMALGQSAAERLGSLLGWNIVNPNAPVTSSVTGAIQPSAPTSSVIDQLTGRPIPVPSGPGSNTPGRGGGGWAGGPLGPGGKAI